MLILGVNKGEWVKVGENVRIKVEEVKGMNSVRLCFDAPIEVSIIRENAKRQMNPQGKVS